MLGNERLESNRIRRPYIGFATLADLEKISIGERKELMGHGRAEMTLHYTHVPSQQVSEVLERLSEKIVTAANLKPGKRKVVAMKKAVQ